MLRYGFVELSTLNIALLRRQPKFVRIPFFHFFFFFIFVFSFILLILGILVLFLFFFFHVFVECFRFTQENKVGVYLMKSSFWGGLKIY